MGVLEWWMSLHLSTISAASAARSVEALRVLTLIFFDPSLFSVITVTPSGAYSWPSSSYSTRSAVSFSASTIAPGRIWTSGGGGGEEKRGGGEDET